MGRKPVSKFSINAILQKTEEKPEETTIQEEKLPSNHFTDTDLQEEWRKFLLKLRNEDIIIFSAISSFKLKKLNEDIVEISYPSDSAKSEFEKVRADFFNHFMHKVNHFNIKIEYKNDVTIKKGIITKKKIFDKFVQINPVLKDLEDLFKFDLNS